MNTNVVNAINKSKRIWRTAALLLLLVALFGPWAFDRIHVPVKYTCSPPNFRLEGDFCGTLGWKGIHILIFIVGGFFAAIVQLVTGTGAFFPDPAEAILRAFFLLPLVLPFLAALLSIFHRDGRQMFHVLAWGLAVMAASLFLSLSSFSRMHWLLWGIWLYIGLAVAVLILELITLQESRRQIRASQG